MHILQPNYNRDCFKSPPKCYQFKLKEEKNPPSNNFTCTLFLLLNPRLTLSTVQKSPSLTETVPNVQLQLPPSLNPCSVKKFLPPLLSSQSPLLSKDALVEDVMMLPKVFKNADFSSAFEFYFRVLRTSGWLPLPLQYKSSTSAVCFRKKIPILKIVSQVHYYGSEILFNLFCLLQGSACRTWMLFFR